MKRLLDSIKVKKNSENKYFIEISYMVPQSEKNIRETKRYIFQSGGYYNTLKEAMQVAQEWLDHKDFFVKNKIFEHKVIGITKG